MTWQIRQATTAARPTYTPAQGELFWDITLKRLFVGDGTTPGGVDPFATDPYGDLFNVKLYGATGDGVTNDTAAIQDANDAALAAGGGVVKFPVGEYMCEAGVTIGDNVSWAGDGKGATIVKRASTGDFITSIGKMSTISDMTIDGDTASRGAGKGIVVSGTFGQMFERVNVTRFVEPCLWFDTDSGSQFRAHACDFYTTGAVGSVGAVTVGGTDTQAVPRHFVSCESNGCTLYNFGNCEHVFVYGGYTNGLIFGANASMVCISGLRNGAAGGTVTVRGSAHKIFGITSAASIVLSCTNSVVWIEAPDWDITDSGTGNQVYTGIKAYTPAWTSSGTAPAIGNGTITGAFTRQGHIVNAVFAINFGSTTNPGTGTWYISLPLLDSDTYIFECGGGRTGGSTATNHAFLMQVQPGLQKAAMFTQTGSNCVALTGTTQSWASDTTVRGQIQYYVP